MKNNTEIIRMQQMVAEFVTEREWNQFHTLKNLSMNIAVEAAELMEPFLWCSTETSGDLMKEKREEIEDEFADVLIGLLCFANAAKIDTFKAFERKLEKTKAKYPVDVVRGRSDKYTYYRELKKKDQR